MRGLKVEEVAVRIGVSTQTLNRWYKFKRENPNDKMSKLLPAYKLTKSDKNLPTRLWKESDIDKLLRFKDNVTRGRDGLMGQYKGKGTKNAEKEN